MKDGGEALKLVEMMEASSSRRNHVTKYVTS